MMKLVPLVALTLALACGQAQAVEVHECDVQAAHPSDPDHVGTAKGSGEVVTHLAIPACRRAVSEYPETARFHYQLGRAIVYWAGANGADDAEGVASVELASSMGHTQAQFVDGLLKARDGKICATEPLYRAAANKGLKSARITYVHNVLSGKYQTCGLTVADLSTQRQYLQGARKQVSGYYENMLLDSLHHQLTSGE